LLFNSFPFIFVFLPIVLAGFFALARASDRLAAGWLTISSLVFYGWWDPAYVALLLASISVNYYAGTRIALMHASGQQSRGRFLLLVAIAANLALLGYYKYGAFFVSNAQKLIGHAGPLPEIVLPLGISFFTFTQIAFLVDAHRGLAREYNFTHYTLFVSYFPHLIAGPILHHREMMPQFDRRATYTLNWDNIAVGLTMFIFGLFKKTMIADDMAAFASPAFNAAAAGTHLTLLEAWGAALAYTFQIYFDFSGYTDMALGASRMFGIVLPLNFFSPYKARSIIDFWRRWHITLSRFLRDYVYIPLGGNRKAVPRRYENLLLTMLVGGALAWRRLDVCLLGRAARRLSCHQPWLEVAAPSHQLHRAGRRESARDIDDIRSGRRRVGLLPSDGLHDGRQHHRGNGGTARRRSAPAMATVRGRPRVVGKLRSAVRQNDLL
jgi:alginate O-acetyltransferase complex protein AlgI